MAKKRRKKMKSSSSSTSTAFLKAQLSFEKEKLRLSKGGMSKELKEVVIKKITKEKKKASDIERIRKLQEQIDKRKITERLKEGAIRKLKEFAKQKVVSRRVLRPTPSGTLDLRTKQIEPVKQHAFKEGEIGTSNLLFPS